MLLRATAKSWRNTTAKAKVAPDRTSKSYKAGRAIGQLARGQKPTKYSEPATPNPLEGKRNVANISAYKDGRRFDYGYDADTGDLYDIRTEIQGDAATNKLHGIPGGVKVTNMMNLKEYQPVDFGTPSDRPGLIKGRGAKGRKYTGVDAVVKALRDEGGDVFVLDKTPGKGKKASVTGGVPHWRSPLTATGEYIDPRKRHEIPTSSNPAKTAHNMFWRQATPISEQEKRAREVLNRGKTDEVFDRLGWKRNPPEEPPQNTAKSPNGPQSGPSQGRFGFGKTRGSAAPQNTAKYRKNTGNDSAGHTPGPPPSQNQASKPDYASVMRALQDKIEIGRGGNAIVYDMPGTDYVVRVPKRGFGLQTPEGKPPTSLTDIPDPFEGRNFGHPVASLGQIQVLRRQKGTPAGLASNKGMTQEEADAKYLKSLEMAAGIPQEGYDKFADDIAYLNRTKRGHVDSSKSSNVLIDPDSGQFNLVDINQVDEEYVGKHGYREHTFSPMPVMLMGNTYASSFKGDKAKAKAHWQAIYQKSVEAAKRKGLKIDEENSSVAYAKNFFGLFDDEQTTPQKTPQAPPGTAIQPWRRPVVRMAGSPQETMPAGELTYEQKGIQGPEELAGLPGYTEIKGRDWYAQKEGAKTQYGTGPKARKLRPSEAKTAKRNARPAAQAEPVAPEPEIVPGDPLALMPPTQQPPAVKEKKAWRNVGKFQGEVVQPQIQRADVYEAENRLASDFARKDMVNLAESGRNNPYVLNENVAKDIETAQAGDAFGLNKAFESEDLTTPEGFQVRPETISVLAKTLSDTEQARRGKVLKSPENPFAYSTQSGPETLPFGTEGDMAIQGRLGIAERTIQEIEAERATSPMPGVEYDRAINRAINQVLIDQAAPAKVLMQQREFLAAANEARAKGDAKLAGKIESFADEIAFAAYSRSPKMLDAFSTQREDTGALMRGSYLSSPQQDESRINVLKRPEIEALEAKMAAGEQLTFDEEYAYKRQAEIDATNLKFSAATGQGGKNPADTKMFNTVAMPSPVPWAKNEKDLLSQMPPTLNEADAADAQFTRELADPSLGNSRFDYPFQPERIGASQPQSPADMIAESLAGRLASVSRHGASLGFASNAVDAAGNRQMLQGEQGDEGYAPQGANKHWSSLGTVEKQLEAIQGGGKVPGMSDVHDATYASTFDEYRAKAEDFMASLPPDMPKDQFDAAVTEFMRGEFNRRVQSDYERLKNPEADTTGGHNIFRMPNTKSMIQDDPTKATLQQVFDGAIPEIVTPQSGDPFDAWNQRLQQEQADTNVANAYGMVDQGIYEKARDFWAGQMTGDTALAAERFQGGRDATKYRDLRPPEALPPPMDLEYPQNVLPEAAPAPTRMGLKRSGGQKPVARTWRQGETRGEMNPSERFSDSRRMASEKQMTRQDRYIFENPGQNAERIEADQLAVGDVVNLHVPTKSGGKLERAEVVHTADGQVALEDGKTFGTILLDQDDPTRDGINVHSIEQHSDPMVEAERKLARILGGNSPFQAQAQAEPGVPEIAAQPEIQAPTSTSPKPAQKGSKTPGLEPAAFEALYGTPFQQIIQGGVSKIASTRTGKGKQQGEYDGGMDFGGFWNTKIFSRTGGRKPDQVHAELVDKGLMPPESTVDDMWNEIGRGIDNYHGQVGQIKQGKAQAQQAERVEKEVFSPKAAKRNPVAVQGRDLIVGQKLEIAVPNAKGRKDQTEIAEVVDIDEDGMATLEDGDRYGPFTVPEDKILYAKRILEGEPQAAQANPWDAPDAFDMRQTAAPGAFSLKNDVPNMNYDTNQGLLLDVDPNDVERLLIEEQRRKNRQRLAGQSDFFGDVPF